MVRKATGASYPAVSDRIVKESMIPAPSMDEQRRIAAILDQADVLHAKRRQVLAHLDALAQSVFHDMFGNPAANGRSLTKRRLGDLSAKFSDGPFGSNLKSSHYVDEGVRVIRLQNIGVGRFLEDDAAYVSREHFLSLSKHRCLPGDVVIGTLGDPNIRACIIPSNIPEALNKADCVQMRVNPGRADAAWVVGLLNSPGMLKIANSGLHGQTRTRIAMGQLREMMVPVPRLEEQQRFARVIDRVGLQRRRVWMGATELESLFASLQSRAFRGEL
jgi:type I restriction enzyme, S subunit